MVKARHKAWRRGAGPLRGLTDLRSIRQEAGPILVGA
jgi:hypothetical protein